MLVVRRLPHRSYIRPACNPHTWDGYDNDPRRSFFPPVLGTPAERQRLHRVGCRWGPAGAAATTMMATATTTATATAAEEELPAVLVPGMRVEVRRPLQGSSFR
jgi:hypothetical protein